MSDIQPHRLRYYLNETESPRVCFWTQVLPWAFTVGAIVAAVAVAWEVWCAFT